MFTLLVSNTSGRVITAADEAPHLAQTVKLEVTSKYYVQIPVPNMFHICF